MTAYAFCWRLDSYTRLSPSDMGIVIGLLVEALAIVNLSYLRDHPSTPSLYQSGIRYRKDAGPTELQWWDIPAILAAGYADCKALAAWAVAEARYQGRQAEPYVSVSENAQVHVQALIDGRVVDPSLRLGMR